MKQLFIYSILCLSLAACGGKKNNAAEPQEKPAADSIVEEKIVALPPLEEGEVFLKDKDPFGEVVELQGNHIVEPDTFIFKPASPNMVIKDSLMIMQSRNAPFYIFRYPEFTYIKTVGRTGNGPDEFVAPYVIASLNPAYLCYVCRDLKECFTGLIKSWRYIRYKRYIVQSRCGTILNTSMLPVRIVSSIPKDEIYIGLLWREIPSGQKK